MATRLPNHTRSTCQHCKREIEWWYDDPSDLDVTYGWWVDTYGQMEACLATDDGWHRPLGAVYDNGWPV